MTGKIRILRTSGSRGALLLIPVVVLAFIFSIVILLATAVVRVLLPRSRYRTPLRNPAAGKPARVVEAEYKTL